MKVVSLVPSATDILIELGAEDELAAVTYACKVPKPVVVKPVINTEGLSPEEIDRLISEYYRKSQRLYWVDVEKIKEIKPDVIFGQGLCEVCAVTADELTQLLKGVAPVVDLHPKSVEEILQDILLVGRQVGRLKEAEDLVEKITTKIERVLEHTSGLEKKRTIFLEWLFPPYCSGHWVPQLVEMAGGIDYGEKARPSRRITHEEIVNFHPSKVVAGPCGYSLEKSIKELERFVAQKWVSSLQAFVEGEVYAVEADKYFSRHGPNVGDAVLILAEIIHPEVFKSAAPPESFKKMNVKKV